jgi:tetratricopeptide (TPR) repeat protein
MFKRNKQNPKASPRMFDKENNPETLIALAAGAEDITVKNEALRRMILVSNNLEQIIKGLFDYTDAIKKAESWLVPHVLKNQDLLIHTLMTCAIGDLDDQELISKLASFESLKVDFRESLISKSNDTALQEKLIKQGMFDNHGAGQLAVSALRSINSPEVKAEVFGNKDATPLVREAAGYGVTNQKVLERVASDKSDCPGTRGMAAKRLSNQKLLRKLAEGCEELRVREGAVWAITDQTFLQSVVLENEEEDMRASALHNIESSDFALRIFETDESSTVKAQAIRRVQDQRKVQEVALDESQGYAVHYAAIDSLSDLEIQKEFYIKSPDEVLTVEVLKKITDQDFLANVAYNGPRPKHRTSALLGISKPEILKELLKHHTDPAVNSAVKTKIQRLGIGEPELTEPQKLVEKALHLVENGQKEEAQKVTKEAIVMGEPLPKAHLLMCDLLAESGDIRAALEHSQKFSTMEPYFAKGWATKGLLLGKLGDMEQSLGAMKRAAVLGNEQAKNALIVKDMGDTCNFCGKQVSALQTAILSNGTYICVNCLEIATKVIAAKTPYVPGKKRRGLISPGLKPCSFCGKNEYRTLVDGGNTAICDGCVDEFFLTK